MGFHGETLLVPRPTPNLKDHPLSALRVCLFNLFAATLHIGGRSSIRNLRTRHAVVTGTHIAADTCEYGEESSGSKNAGNSATLPLSGPQPTTTPGHYTTCCKSQSYAPEDGQKIDRKMLS